MLLADGTSLNVVVEGHGYPVIFQHGLGGDRNQVAESFPDNAGFRRITVECRAHGLSDKGDVAQYSIAGFADDVLAVANARGIERFTAGGISMGAAIALRLAVMHPERVSALMLVRPAWITTPAPDNMQPFTEAARLMRVHGRQGGDLFARSPTGLRLAAAAPDNLASLLGFFDRDDLPGLADLLEAIALDGPGLAEQQLAKLDMPVLVVGHSHDLVHPLHYAHRLAMKIPRAHLAEITPKAIDKARYTTELRAAIGAFLRRFAPSEDPI